VPGASSVYLPRSRQLKEKRKNENCNLPGDGIGPEIVEQAVHVLKALDEQFEMETAPVGGAGYEVSGHPLPEATLKLAQDADAVLFGSVGDWKYDTLERALRPEQAILGLRKNLNLFANFRPAILYPELAGASTLKPEVVSGLDILIIRELTGDIYLVSHVVFGFVRMVRLPVSVKVLIRCVMPKVKSAGSHMWLFRRRKSVVSDSPA